ncbi:site-specific integrase [Enterococcus avium]|uniref:tyrosine-type recombinase/integrase n=1 Tax=Enterococcus TaxID=1350 RepID=UPI0028903E0D|nr:MULTISPECIES: site-specific integrase [Enterococcus]MDT2423783.1 site-specific integrase [Enterococcus avium]MDT2436782.1 site-specific integrase [Enterococcus avium]MDT2465946.1 site-specific integrase [Enterococcus avium]MDT2505369.1 site-specific integrase [Enterococcus avium]MDT2525344.1 site-specific integrase [Enterococcus raffinosus]
MVKFIPYNTMDGKKYYKAKGYIGTDPDTGKKKVITISKCRTKREAELAFSKRQNEFQQNGFTAQTKTTFQEVYDLWLETYKLSVKESTFVKQTEQYRIHILPYFGKKQISKITTAQVQKFANDKVKKFKRYREFISNTSRIFDYAIRRKIISKNPVKNIDIPVPPSKIDDDAKENYLSKDELIVFLNALDNLDNMKQATFLHLLAMSGCRMGELLGLQWKNVFFNEGYIKIKQSLARGIGRRLYLETPKTKSSIREIPLDAETVKALKTWKAQQRKDLLAIGFNSMSPEQLVFSKTNTNGFIQLSTPIKWLNKVLNRLDIKRITLHGLRHTHATMLLESGRTLKDVSARLGHSSIEITSDLYIHVTEKRSRESVNELVNYLES